MMNQQDIEYSLAKRVPDMARGFTVSTNYGDIDIPPGRMADAVARALTRALQCELLAAVKRAERVKGA